LYKYLGKVLFHFAIIYPDFFTCCSATNKRLKFGLHLEYLHYKVKNVGLISGRSGTTIFFNVVYTPSGGNVSIIFITLVELRQYHLIQSWASEAWGRGAVSPPGFSNMVLIKWREA